MSFDDDTSEAKPDGLPPGTTLSDTYEIVKMIALGGMAEVYRARNIHTDEPVAIKVVLPEFARDQTNLALFRKEATVLGRLHHESIVRYHTFSVEKILKRPYLAMEFVDGIALSDFIKKKPLNAAETRLVITRVASGLAAAHDLGVIHRDLSPDNVILPDGNVAKTKIIDFGIAKSSTIGEGTLLGGKFAGKYNFVSPEQLGLAGGDVTERSDIYSLGLIAAAAMLGKPLDMSGSQLDVLEKRRRIPDLTGVDPAMQPVIAKMLEPLPEDRPKDMRAVIELLAAPPSALQRLPDTGTVFGGEMPFKTTPPTSDPWADTSFSARSIPPQNQPPAQQGSWPREQTGQGSMPQGGFGAFPPPGPGSMPQGGFSQPQETSYGTRGRDTSFGTGPAEGTNIGEMPTQPQFGGPSEKSSGPRSESPFGPGPTTPPTFGKTQPGRGKAKKGGSGGLIAIAAVAVVLLGGGAVFVTQGGFGLLGSAPTPVVTPETPEVPVTPEIPETPETPPPEIVADIPETPPVVPPTVVLEGAAKNLAWLKDYGLDECQFATPLTVADNAMGIEAFGNDTAPFEALVANFERDNGFEPDVGVRLIVDPQCAAADFLRAAQVTSAPGPTMVLETDTLASGASLEGTLTGTDGWTTDLLLVDYRGGVLNLTQFLTSVGDTASFASPPLTSKTSDAVPMMVIAISNKGGLNSTRLVRTHEARSIFPVILREIQSESEDVSVTARYFRLGGTD